jgi:chloride channel protein, CIC family
MVTAKDHVASQVIREKLFSLLLRLVPTERQRLLVLTILSGGLCGLVAVAFHVGIDKASLLLIDRAASAPHHSWIYLTILSPALGGLVAGLGLRYWVPGAVGSGIPQVKYAYARDAGRVPMKDAIGKFVLAVIQIGSGASLGREGPTVQICAGVTSMLGKFGKLSRQNQRRMASVGVAAGIAAAFNAPIAAVTFTLEEVIGDLDQTMLSGVIVAAALAAVVERSILGQHPVLEIMRTYNLGSASSLVWYAVLGVLSGLISVAFTDSLLGLRAQFKRLTSVPKWAHPAIGGAVTGALAVIGLAWLHTGGIAGGGYATLGRALMGSLPLKVLAVLCVLKFAATIFSYSSGGVGGIYRAGTVHRRHAGRHRRLHRCRGLPSSDGGDRRLRRRGHGGGLCGHHPRAHDFSSDHLRDDRWLRTSSPAHGREHDRLRPGAELPAHTNIRSTAGTGWHSVAAR